MTEIHNYFSFKKKFLYDLQASYANTQTNLEFEDYVDFKYTQYVEDEYDKCVKTVSARHAPTYNLVNAFRRFISERGFNA